MGVLRLNKITEIGSVFGMCQLEGGSRVECWVGIWYVSLDFWIFVWEFWIYDFDWNFWDFFFLKRKFSQGYPPSVENEFML